jgi:hypothetical protein
MIQIVELINHSVNGIVNMKKQMIKRKDGSVSQRGLWDNLRSKAAQNKKTGAKPKAPTKAMLTQEKRIKAAQKVYEAEHAKDKFFEEPSCQEAKSAT